MKDRPIKAGDLVMVVKPRYCGCPGKVGHVGIVKEIRMSHGLHCEECGKRPGDVIVAVWFDRDSVCPVDRLIRIDPPVKGDSLPTREELHA